MSCDTSEQAPPPEVLLPALVTSGQPALGRGVQFPTGPPAWWRLIDPEERRNDGLLIILSSV